MGANQQPPSPRLRQRSESAVNVLFSGDIQNEDPLIDGLCRRPDIVQLRFDIPSIRVEQTPNSVSAAPQISGRARRPP